MAFESAPQPQNERDWEGIHGDRQWGEHIVVPYTQDEIDDQIRVWGRIERAEQISQPEAQGEDNGTE